MDGIEPEPENCLLEAGLITVQIANTSMRAHKRLIFVGEHFPDCSGDGESNYWETCLTEISAANFQKLRLDTFYVPSAGIAFWQLLADINRGASQSIW